MLPVRAEPDLRVAARPPRSRRRLFLALGAALVLASCTTVTRTAVRAGNGEQTGGVLGDPAAGSVDASGVAAGGAGAPRGGGAGAGGAAGGSAAAAGRQAAGGGEASGVAPAGTTCKTPVLIGVSYSSDLGPGLAALGNPGAAADAANYARDVQAIWQRGVDDLNARGGLAGCKVTLVFHDYKVLSPSGFSGESQSECADFAEDKKVFAAITGTGALENRTLVECMAQHKAVTLFNSPVYQPSPQDYARYRGYLYEPTGITPYRFGSFIDQYDSVGYFPPRGGKVGILMADDGSGSNQYVLNQLWKPKLDAKGLTTSVFTYSLIQNVSDNTRIASQFNSAVLQFKAQGVTHVMVLPDNGTAVIFFTQVAESQNYRPRYAFSSADAPAAWANAPQGQRAGAVNISYSLIDLGGKPDPGELASNGANPSRARCDALFHGHTGSNPVIAAYPTCDSLEFLRLSFLGAPGVTSATLLGGVDRLGSAMPLVNAYGNALFRPPDRYDGASNTRVMVWDEPHLKWHYATGFVPVP